MKRRGLYVVTPILLGLILFVCLEQSLQRPDVALATSNETGGQLLSYETPERSTVVLTSSIVSRLSNMLATNSRSAQPRIPHQTTLNDIQVQDRVITVVLNIPESALYDAKVVVDSDAINEAVLQSLYDSTFLKVIVLTTDPRHALSAPLPIHFFAKLRAVEAKPSETAAGNSTTEPFARQNSASAFRLTGKSIYLSAGHGWYYHPTYGWITQRGLWNGLIEDLNNAEVVDQYLIAYLRQAGADVFPARDPSLNTAEVIADNDVPGYTEMGTWVTNSNPGYKGGTARYASTTNGQPTATASWARVIPVSGWYPVYAWYNSGPSHAPDVTYAIEYGGGVQTVTVSQRVHGYTWRFLGSYFFHAGATARVTVTNRSNVSGAVVMADAIRWGGGIGDIVRGSGASNKPRFEEASRYWALLLGAPVSVYDSNAGDVWCGTTSPDACDDITTRPRYADWENQGTGDDAVFVSWHTNGHDGTARGTVSYVYNNDSTPPYDQYKRITGSLELQSAVHNRVIQAIHTAWDPTWYDRGKQQANLGEVRVAQTMPSMLIEMAFHDNPIDAAALREPYFEQMVARAVYQGIVNYYAQKGGVTPVYLPESPQRFSMLNLGYGQIKLSWHAPPTFAFGTPTNLATRYRVYLSKDGLAWDAGREVIGTSLVLEGYSNAQIVYARVTAVNEGGESFPTHVLALRVGRTPRALIVAGFDSLDAGMRPAQTVGGYTNTSRLLLDQMNRMNYIIQHAQVLTEAFDSAVHQAVANGDVSLNSYQFVDWFTGQQSIKEGSLNGAERQALRKYVTLGHRVLMINGANIAAQLALSDVNFLNTVLHTGFQIDNAGASQVQPLPTGYFQGIGVFNLDDGAHGTYRMKSNDGLAAGAGAQVVLQYDNGIGAGTAFHAPYSLTVLCLGFPFETIYPLSSQQALMRRALSALTRLVTITADSTVSVGVPLWLSVTTGLAGGVNFLWNAGDGATQNTGMTPYYQHLFFSPGQYTITVTATQVSTQIEYVAFSAVQVVGHLDQKAYLPIVIRDEEPVVEARAVWISRFDWCGTPPCLRSNLEKLINHAADARFNIVLFQVRATGDAYYTPGLEPWSYRLTSNQTNTLGTDPGWDPLQVAVDLAHARGIELHAYVNLFSAWECNRWMPPHTTPEHLFWTLGNYQPNPYTYSSTWRVYSTTASGPQPMSVLRSAPVPCDDYLWSSPGVSRVNEHNLRVVKDIVIRYAVDGVHLDRVRYPGPPYSSDPESLSAWSAVSTTVSFADWQRDNLSRWITRIYTEAHALRPQVKVSAAVWFTYKKTGAISFPTSQGYYDYYQDSHGWLNNGSLDAIAPMIYGATFNSDIAKWKALADDHVAAQNSRQVWLGIGGAITPFSSIVERINYARMIGARGIALWSAGALEDNAYWDDLAEGVFQEPARVP